MCRVLGIVAERPTQFSNCLREAPQSLFALSREHPDGWGTAVYAADGWQVRKNAVCADGDEQFTLFAAKTSGIALVAHVRKRTVGAASLANTHPFHRDHWVLAHNGTIEDLTHLQRHTSLERAREREGDTDSEWLFAFLLTRLDARGLTRAASVKALDETIAMAMDELQALQIGSLNIVLSNGAVMYAFRQGRSLYALERVGNEKRPASFLVASEPITQEPWVLLDEGTLLRCDRMRSLETRFLRGRDPGSAAATSEVELPFTD